MLIKCYEIGSERVLGRSGTLIAALLDTGLMIATSLRWWQSGDMKGRDYAVPMTFISRRNDCMSLDVDEGGKTQMQRRKRLSGLPG